MNPIKQILFFLSVIMLQFSVLPRFCSSIFEPDFLLMVVVLSGLHKRPETACAIGFFLGVLNDVNSGVILGSHALIWTQIAMLNATIRNYLVVDSPSVQIVMAALSCLLAGSTQFGLHQLTVLHEPFNHYFLLLISRTIVTAVLTWPLWEVMKGIGLLSEHGNA